MTYSTAGGIPVVIETFSFFPAPTTSKRVGTNVWSPWKFLAEGPKRVAKVCNGFIRSWRDLPGQLYRRGF